MSEGDLQRLIAKLQNQGCETQTIEAKAAKDGPPKIYDTLSSFSNQADGGVILFGVDERENFDVTGVYDAKALQNEIVNMACEMEPVVRPVITVYTTDSDKTVVAAEIPPMELTNRPCYKKTAGSLKGSYVRVGDSDQHMTAYEVYAFEAYRKRTREDMQTVDDADRGILDAALVDTYMERRTRERANLAQLSTEKRMEMLGLTKEGQITLMALLMTGKYPQSLFPQLSIAACRLPGTQMGEVTGSGSRFLSSKRIEGTLPEMLHDAIAYVEAQMRTEIGVDRTTGLRFDKPEYPIEAVREIILNALIHRDYSKYTQSMPIQLHMYADRLEVRSPGALYGHIGVEDLGHMQPETRNMMLVTAMEAMGYTENRYSGIPRIRRLMAEEGLPQPVFESRRGEFTVRLYNGTQKQDAAIDVPIVEAHSPDSIIEFCAVPRSRREIADHLGISSQGYAVQRYVMPLVDSGELQLTMPEKPKSAKQRFVAAAPH